jgi:hypothetical protein
LKQVIKSTEFELETATSKVINQGDISTFLKKTISDRDLLIDQCNKDNSQVSIYLSIYLSNKLSI